MFEKFVNYQIGIFAVRLNRIYAPYKRLFHILECQESGVRSQESGVRSQESGVRSQESGVRMFEKLINLWMGIAHPTLLRIVQDLSIR